AKASSRFIPELRFALSSGNCSRGCRIFLRKSSIWLLTTQPANDWPVIAHHRYTSHLAQCAFRMTNSARNSLYENNATLHPRSHSDCFVPLPAMRDDYLKAALKTIDDPNILFNVVSRRVKQLRRGSRPLVESLEKLSAEDTALREIMEGKISYEAGPVEERPDWTGP